MFEIGKKIIRVGLTCLLVICSMSITAEDQGGHMKYYTAALFSDGAYGNQSSIDKLKQEGWDLTLVQKKQSMPEIESTILQGNKNKEALKDFDEKYSKVISHERKKYDLSKSDLNIPQQNFGYLLGEKSVGDTNYYTISFMGTSDFYSWIFTDFMAFPVEFLETGTHVHSGFEWNREACLKTSEINELLKKFEFDPKGHLLLTGHSLGGAVAVLEAAAIISSDKTIKDKITVYTFAEPCPGKSDFADKFKNEFTDYRWFVNFGDVVPELPMILGYRHFNYFFGIYLFNKGAVRINDMKNIEQWKKYVKDRHEMKYYLEAAKELDAITI